MNDDPCFPSVTVIDQSDKTNFLSIDAPCKGNIMKKLLAALFAAMFALGTVAVFAADVVVTRSRDNDVIATATQDAVVTTSNGH